jgi:hypothetical protein
VAAEIVKEQLATGRRREIYHFREEQGLEVDFVVPGRRGTVTLVECEAGRTVTPTMAAPLTRLGEAWKASTGRRGVEKFLVHQPPRAESPTSAVAPGVRAMSWQEFLSGGGGR